MAAVNLKTESEEDLEKLEREEDPTGNNDSEVKAKADKAVSSRREDIRDVANAEELKKNVSRDDSLESEVKHFEDKVKEETVKNQDPQLKPKISDEADVGRTSDESLQMNIQTSFCKKSLSTVRTVEVSDNVDSTPEQVEDNTAPETSSTSSTSKSRLWRAPSRRRVWILAWYVASLNASSDD